MNNKIINICLGLAAAISVWSCDKIAEIESKLLTVETLGKSTIEDNFSIIDGLTQAGEGLHDCFSDFYDGYYIKYAEAMGNTLDIVTTAGDGDNLLYNYELNPEHVATYPRTLWGSGWTVVSNANYMIEYGPALYKDYPEAGDKRTIDRMLAWAYFARGFAHWCLCNCYAQPYSFTKDASHIGVPVVTGIPGFRDQIKRESVAKVYARVLEDLNKALELFGEENSVEDQYHFNGVACEALLARVYLYMRDWENAEKYSSMVMKKVRLTSKEKYTDFFRNSFSLKASDSEAILRWNHYDKTSTLVSSFDPSMSTSLDFVPTKSFASQFESDDVRKALLTYIPESVEPAQMQGKTFDAVCKFCPLKSISDNMLRVANPVALRVSEMYLIHAEALANGTKKDFDGAVKDIAALRARAKGVDASSIVIAYSNLDSVNEIIMQERVKELCFEGHSLFDLTRAGKDIVRPADSPAKIKLLKYGDYRTILPINRVEMQSNDTMMQNEGY